MSQMEQIHDISTMKFSVEVRPVCIYLSTPFIYRYIILNLLTKKFLFCFFFFCKMMGRLLFWWSTNIIKTFMIIVIIYYTYFHVTSMIKCNKYFYEVYEVKRAPSVYNCILHHGAACNKIGIHCYEFSWKV